MKKSLRFLLTVTFLLIPFWAWAGNESSGTITMEFDLSGHNANNEAQLWIPYPLSDRDQLISKVKVTGDFAESAVYSDQVYSTPILYARWDKGSASRKLTLSFHVVRQEVVRRDFPANEVAWDPADYAMYLKPTSLGPIDGQVKVLADQITQGKTGVLEKAKAIYDWTCENMYRDPNTRGCGPGDVCSLLATPGGKCTDIHSVFCCSLPCRRHPCPGDFRYSSGKKSRRGHHHMATLLG